MSVAGTYTTTVKSPMGDQKGTLTVNQGDGNSWTGTMAGGLGSMDIKDGTVDGNTLHWTMDMTVPMPMKLTCEATVDGDTLTGKVNAGAFGDMPLSGERTCLTKRRDTQQQRRKHCDTSAAHVARDFAPFTITHSSRPCRFAVSRQPAFPSQVLQVITF